MKSRAFLAILITVLIVSGLYIYTLLQKEESTFRLSIVSIVEIQPIADLRQGFKEIFLSSDYAKKHQISVEELNAQGDPSLINQIADRLVTTKPDLVFVLGTPMAQAIQKRAPDLLLVQGAVTDPIEAGLANSWESSGKRYIATSDLPPIPKLINLIKELSPQVKRLGVIYNPGEPNSVAVIKRLRSYLEANKVDWQLVEAPVASTVEVPTAVESLVGRVDAIFMPPDNTAAAAMSVIGKVAREHKIPFYATNSSVLEHGALAVVSLDFVQLGRESAYLALEVLNGKDPAKMPIKLMENPTIYVNQKLASEYGIDLTNFQKQANTIVR